MRNGPGEFSETMDGSGAPLGAAMVHDHTEEPTSGVVAEKTQEQIITDLYKQLDAAFAEGDIEPNPAACNEIAAKIGSLSRLIEYETGRPVDVRDVVRTLGEEAVQSVALKSAIGPWRQPTVKSSPSATIPHGNIRAGIM